MSAKRIDGRAAGFMRFLERYRHDKGALANLRGALSDTRRHRAWPLLGGFKEDEAIGNPTYEIVAALWAHAKDESDEKVGNLGATLRVLGGKYDVKSGKFEHDSFQGRFKRLLSCDKEDVTTHVAPVVRAAVAKGVGVDFPRLLSDLLWWGEKVKVEWAKAFWEVQEEDGGLSSNFIDKEDSEPVGTVEVAP